MKTLLSDPLMVIRSSYLEWSKAFLLCLNYLLADIKDEHEDLHYQTAFVRKSAFFHAVMAVSLS